MRKKLTKVTLSILALTCLAYPLQAATRIRVESGTKLPVRLERGVGTKDFYQWHSFGPVRTVSGTLVQDIVAADGQVALPAGTKISVAVLEAKRAGHLMGRSKLRLGLYSVATPDGEVIPIDGYPTTLNHRKVDREGTEHGHGGLVKDAGVDVASVTTGAGGGLRGGRTDWRRSGRRRWSVDCRGVDSGAARPGHYRSPRAPWWNLWSAGRCPSSPPVR